MLYCRTKKNGKVHRVAKVKYFSRNYNWFECGQSVRFLNAINSTEEEYQKNGCKSCKEAVVRKAIVRMKYGI